jgi:hypothetical protein
MEVVRDRICAEAFLGILGAVLYKDVWVVRLYQLPSVRLVKAEMNKLKPLIV